MRIGRMQTGASRAPWYTVAVLTACFTLSFVDRQILSLLVGPIKRDLGISDTRIGLLQGLAFSVFYTLMGLPLGRIADRYNRRNLIGVSVLLWSLFTGACSLARSFASLVGARFGVAIGEAGLSPGAFSIVADTFPPDRLSEGISVFYFGVFFGSALALLLGGATVQAVAHYSAVTLPLIGPIAPWRITFLIAALPGIPCALLMWTLREPVRMSLLRGGEKLDARATLGQIRKRWQSVAGISLGMIFQSSCTYSFVAWAPTFFARRFHWAAGETGRDLALIVAVFGSLGLYAGGRLSDRWLRSARRDGPVRVALPSAVGIAILFPAAFLSHSPKLSLALMAPALFFLALPMGTAAAGLQKIFPNQVRGQVSAFYLFCLNLGGLSMGPLVPGLLNDRVFHSEAALGASLAITIGTAALLMLITFSLTLRPFRSDYMSLNQTPIAKEVAS